MDSQGARRSYRRQVRRQRRLARSRLDQLLQDQQHQCHYCRQPIARLRAIPPSRRLSVDRGLIRYAHGGGMRLVRLATVDHQQPLREGGTSSPDNLVAACWSCNQQRAGSLRLPSARREARKRTKTVDRQRRLARLVHRLELRIATRRRQLRRSRRRLRKLPRSAQLLRSTYAVQRHLRLLCGRRERLRRQLAALQPTMVRCRAIGSSPGP